MSYICNMTRLTPNDALLRWVRARLCDLCVSVVKLCFFIEVKYAAMPKSRPL